jgi:hypothetical protein
LSAAIVVCAREWSAPLTFLENVSGMVPQQATTIRVRHDGEALHVGFVCVDAEPWATITQRDGPLWEEEVVEVFIDPVGDRECYFEVEVNPLGTIVDLVLRRNRSGYARDFTWDCQGLATDVHRIMDGWSVEMKIPFAALSGEAPRHGSAWRANFTRIDRPPNGERELSAWVPTRLPTFHAPERFGTLRFQW